MLNKDFSPNFNINNTLKSVLLPKLYPDFRLFSKNGFPEIELPGQRIETLLSLLT